MTNYELMQKLLIENGMQSKVAKGFIKKFKIEELSYSCSDESKKWAMSKGFFPSRIKLYGLNEDNYTYFLPDYADFMMHPYNNHFAIWINDKLSLKYTLGKDFSHILPRYYLYIENNGDYTYLQDAPYSVKKDKDFILNLLKEKKVVIIKPNSSKSGGEGVMKVEYINALSTDHILGSHLEDKIIRINNKELLSVSEFQNRICNLYNCIVTEYVFQHSNLKKIWPESECTLRVIMVKLPHHSFYSQSQWKCIISFARFGTSVSGGTSNVSAGGIGVGFNFENGELHPFGIRELQFSPNGEWRCHEHPDTHIVWKEEKIPNWDYVRDNLYKVCEHYGSLSHLGFDVIITEKGFVLCEINSKPAINIGQVLSEPTLLSEDNKKYFISKGLDKIDCSKLYSIYEESQQ